MAGETLALIIGIAVVAIALVAGLLTSGRRRPLRRGPQHRRHRPAEPGGRRGRRRRRGTRRDRRGVAPRPHAREARGHRLTAGPPAPAARRIAGRPRPRAAGLLSRERLDEDTWESIEDTLLTADLGVAPTQQVVDNLRTRLRVEGERPDVRAVLREELVALVDPSMDRRLAVTGDGLPGVLLIVGVNGSGKTTTVGKIARILVAEDRTVVLGAADTFRAAAVDQLATWAERVGVEVVRGAEATDPASVAFDAVKEGVERGADTVIIDTAGRLQNKAGLMDELGKVKRVIEKQAPVTEVLLVLDATTGQNGLVQAKVFSEVVNVTGVVLTKLDGSAKGGIVVAVQQQLGVPVKLVGLGEGPDDLAPFDPGAFVDALWAELAHRRPVHTAVTNRAYSLRDRNMRRRTTKPRSVRVLGIGWAACDNDVSTARDLPPKNYSWRFHGLRLSGLDAGGGVHGHHDDHAGPGTLLRRHEPFQVGAEHDDDVVRNDRDRRHRLRPVGLVDVVRLRGHRHDHQQPVRDLRAQRDWPVRTTSSSASS